MGENTHSILNQRQSTEERSSSNNEADWLSARQDKDIINDRKRLDNDDLPTTSINSDRLLHAGGKRSQLLEGKQPLRNLDGKQRELHKIPNSVGGKNIVVGGVTDVLQRRYTDEDDWLNAHQANVVINDRKRLDDGLPMTSINSDRLLHVSGRRLHLLKDQQQIRNVNDIQSERSEAHNNLGLTIGKQNVEDQHKVKDGSSDEIDWLNAHQPSGVLNERRRLDADLPMTSINSDRLLHISGRRLRFLEDQQTRSNLGDDDDDDDNDKLVQWDRSHISNNIGLGIENEAKVDYKDKAVIHEQEQLDDDMPTTGRRLQLLQGKKQIRMQPRKALEDTNIMDEDRIIQRVPRSLNRNLNDEHHRARINQLILYQLQQLVARLNIEQISLQNDDDYDTLQNDHSKSIIVGKLNEISERLDQSMQQILSHLSQRQSYYDKLNVDDDVILQELDRVALGEILQEVIQLSEYVHGNQISNMLENSTTQLMLRHIVNTVERHMQTLKRNRKSEDIGCNAVSINNVKIDGLHTFVEEVDIDLTNLQGVMEDNNKKKIIIGRVPRLNHKSFPINIDLTSDRNQRVIVRTLLIPKIDAKENQRSLDLQRHNTLLLDIVDVTLKVGRNSIKRKSRDITWTGRDVSSYTEIYERVLRTLRGDVDLTSDVIVGQTTLFPDRLLLPRGRVNGLPMQVLVVITPATTSGKDLSNHVNTNLGLDSLILDNLPMIYPMDRGVTDVKQMLALPNVFLKDVVIYHEDKISHMLN